MRNRTSTTLMFHLSSKAVHIITYFLLIKLQSVVVFFFPFIIYSWHKIVTEHNFKVMVYQHCAIGMERKSTLKAHPVL